MRILHISEDFPPYAQGGSARIAYETCQRLQAIGHDVTVLASGPESVRTLQQINGLRTITLPQKSLRFAHYRAVFSAQQERAVLAVIDEVQPQVIHAHGLAWQLGYRWLEEASIRGIPVFYTAHSVMPVAYGKVPEDDFHPWKRDLMRMKWEWNPLRNRYIRRYLSYCEQIICVSDALKHYLSHFGFRKLTTIHNGIDVNFWRPKDKKTSRRELGLPLDEQIALLAGRLGHDKGTSLVANALPERTHLLLAGELKGATELQSLGGRLHAYHHQTPAQMQTLYAAADIVLVPSTYLDPFPTVCLEAMACGRPLIATTMGGSKEAVIENENGWVIDPRNATAWKERLEWCGKHDEQYELMGNIGRKTAEKNFNLHNNVEQLLALYRTAIDDSRRSALRG